MHSLTLVLCVALVGWLLVREARRREGVSSAVWLVLIWTVIIASRPVSSWFNYSGTGDAAEAYDAGNPIERAIFFVLILVACFVLARRRVDWRQVIRANGVLLLFYLFWFFSIAWSDSPWIAGKRWVKDFGNVIMALVILTEEDPVEATFSLFERCASLLLPLSVLFIRYIPHLGRDYGGWSGQAMYVGVAQHKNTLGQLLFVCGLFVFFRMLYLGWTGLRADRVGAMIRVALLGMVLWLLHMANSATSLLCITLGAAFLVAFSFERIRRRMHVVQTGILVAGLGLFLLNIFFDVKKQALEAVSTSVGRDATLTGRTDAWELLLAQKTNPVWGEGFNSFWTGDRLRKMWESYEIIQAHNGYLEVYLNGGVLGLLFLGGLLVSWFYKVRWQSLASDRLAPLRLVLLLTAVVYNTSEATFSKVCILWFALMVTLIDCPRPVADESDSWAEEDPESPDEPVEVLRPKLG